MTYKPRAEEHLLAWYRLVADAGGYETPLSARPNKYLCELERRGLIERNPCSAGSGTQWRVRDV